MSDKPPLCSDCGYMLRPGAPDACPHSMTLLMQPPTSTQSDKELREAIGSLFTEEGDHFEQKLDKIMHLTAEETNTARIETASKCIQLLLGTKTNDFDKLFEKLKAYKATLKANKETK